jgi:photosystem II stability/assembly factor-like uncharacterized protein
MTLVDGSSANVDEQVAERAPENDAEALFEEARRRRRRRRLLATCAVVAAVSTTVGLIVGLGGRGPGKGEAGRSGPAGTTSTGGHGSSSSAPSPAPPGEAIAQQLGVLGQGREGLRVGWAVGPSGIFLTTDGGKLWRGITPKLLADQVPEEVVGTITAASARDLWIPVADVKGIVPAAAVGSNAPARGSGIERTTNGGRSWKLSVLPGCLTSCAQASVSFPDARIGFALVPPEKGESARLYVSVDGGRRWTLRSRPPGFGSPATVVFSNRSLGWAVSGSPRNWDQAPWKLWRTTNGGRTWRRAPDLPSADRYQLPIVFSHNQAVVLGLDGPEDRSRLTVFVTRDGGRSWSSHRLPGTKNLHSFGGAPLAPGGIPFAASSLHNWSLFIGPTLFTTTDAGERWEDVVPSPSWGTGSLLHLVFGSTERGWAVATDSTCRNSAAMKSCILTPSMLYETRNGGRSWRLLPYARTVTTPRER